MKTGRNWNVETFTKPWKDLEVKTSFLLGMYKISRRHWLLSLWEPPENVPISYHWCVTVCVHCRAQSMATAAKNRISIWGTFWIFCPLHYSIHSHLLIFSYPKCRNNLLFPMLFSRSFHLCYANRRLLWNQSAFWSSCFHHSWNGSSFHPSDCSAHFSLDK